MAERVGAPHLLRLKTNSSGSHVLAKTLVLISEGVFLLQGQGAYEDVLDLVQEQRRLLDLVVVHKKILWLTHTIRHYTR